MLNPHLSAFSIRVFVLCMFMASASNHLSEATRSFTEILWFSAFCFQHLPRCGPQQVLQGLPQPPPPCGDSQKATQGSCGCRWGCELSRGPSKLFAGHSIGPPSDGHTKSHLAPSHTSPAPSSTPSLPMPSNTCIWCLQQLEMLQVGPRRVQSGVHWIQLLIASVCTHEFLISET